uniref:Uncharacterized protein n=1 Tax=Melopsittacus undulatus TaxID=13146 RepID=A0A8V5FQ77_MELUD
MLRLHKYMLWPIFWPGEMIIFFPIVNYLRTDDNFLPARISCYCFTTSTGNPRAAHRVLPAAIPSLTQPVCTPALREQAYSSLRPAVCPREAEAAGEQTGSGSAPTAIPGGTAGRTSGTQRGSAG